jgi:hypothetical protein
MIDETHDSDGRGALRDRVPRVLPPSGLEERVHATLTARRLIRRGSARHLVWAARAGILAAGFVLGLSLRSIRGAPEPPPAEGRAGQYALLLYGVPPEDTGAVHAARAREYGRWASSLPDGVRWVGGSELAGVVEALGPAGTRPPRRDERMAGYFIIQASSPERAAEVARTCPHLRYGGRVVVMAVAS